MSSTDSDKSIYDCATATGTDRTYPNMNRRITPWLAGFISSNRVAYP